MYSYLLVSSVPVTNFPWFCSRAVLELESNPSKCIGWPQHDPKHYKIKGTHVRYQYTWLPTLMFCCMVSWSSTSESQAILRRFRRMTRKWIKIYTIYMTLVSLSLKYQSVWSTKYHLSVSHHIEITGLYRPKNDRITLEWHWTLNCQNYHGYTLNTHPKTPLSFILLYIQWFSRQHIVLKIANAL